MILQALYEYYSRRMADPDPARRLPGFGLEEKEIAFVLDLELDGRLVGVTDTRALRAGKKVARRYSVPASVKRTVGVAPNLLWDNAEYALGIPNQAKWDDARASGKEPYYLERVARMHEAFCARVRHLQQAASGDRRLDAVLSFLAADPVEEVRAKGGGEELSAASGNVSFRIVGEDILVCEDPDIQARIAALIPGGGIERDTGADDESARVCLVTGEMQTSARLHPPIKGVWGAQSSGADIVSFNLPAFCSFGRAQGANAPISEAAVFGYTTALNALLDRDSRQRIQVGDASAVFWAQRQDPVEDWLAEILGDRDDPDAHVQRVRSLLESVRSGAFEGMRGKNSFYLLALAPNAARLSVRFWYAGTLDEVTGRIGRWFDDLAIVRGPRDGEYPSLFRVLKAVAVQGKAENIPPRLGGDLLRSIFFGGAYPANWLVGLVQRCRAERDVGHLRAASLKAVLNRSAIERGGHVTSPLQEMKYMLDPDNQSPAYRLGRLFATLEKVQEEANPGINATIRERYYGAASSTPVAVFTTLLRLKNHHLAKLAKGRGIHFEKLVGQILGELQDFPAHLDLADQGRFAIGYYHQRQAFFTQRESAAADNGDNAQNHQGED